MTANKPDKYIIYTTLTLLVVGTIMIFSASYAIGLKNYNDATYFLKRHIIKVIIAGIIMLAASKIDYHWLKIISLPLLIFSSLLLAATLVPSISGAQEIQGARRWLPIFGGLSIQPSEFAKIALIIFICHQLAHKEIKSFFKDFLPILIGPAIVLTVIILQPNYGTTIAIATIISVLIFISGVKFQYLIAVFLAGALLLTSLLLKSPHSRERLMAFIGLGDPQQELYQGRQSKISLGSGGFLGKGLGDGKQQLFYLPEPFTDFIYSIIGEEFGFLGTAAVLLIFLLFGYRGLKIALRAPDKFGFFLATGLTLMIVVYALFNISVATGIFPTTGLPLPLISYGGSALVVNLIAIGIIINISTQVERPLEEKLDLRDLRANLNRTDDRKVNSLGFFNSEKSSVRQ